MNAEKLRLTAANHSPGPSFSGELGTCPGLGSRSVAVDNAEAAELGLRLALPPAPEHQPGGGADAARKEEANSERPDRNRREIGAQLGADVGCLADLLAKRLRCTGKLLNLLGKQSVRLVEAPPKSDDWYANLLWLDRRKCLLITHAGTLFSLFVVDVRIADLRPFERRIGLPEHVDPEGARAVYERGLLVISLPVAAAPPRQARISIQVRTSA